MSQSSVLLQQAAHIHSGQDTEQIGLRDRDRLLVAFALADADLMLFDARYWFDSQIIG
jgi:hypothetical protein